MLINRRDSDAEVFVSNWRSSWRQPTIHAQCRFVLVRIGRSGSSWRVGQDEFFRASLLSSQDRQFVKVSSAEFLRAQGRAGADSGTNRQSRRAIRPQRNEYAVSHVHRVGSGGRRVVERQPVCGRSAEDGSVQRVDAGPGRADDR